MHLEAQSRKLTILVAKQISPLGTRCSRREQRYLEKQFGGHSMLSPVLAASRTFQGLWQGLL